MRSPSNHIILGHPWLVCHNPSIDWRYRGCYSRTSRPFPTDARILRVATVYLSWKLIVFANVPLAIFPGLLSYLAKTMDKYCTNSLASGLIRPFISTLGTGFFFVTKKDGKRQPWINYWELNDISVCNKSPVPQSLFRGGSSSATKFTKFDLQNIYHLVRISKGDEWKMAFNTFRGHIEYLVLLFGLTNVPAVFQVTWYKSMCLYTSTTFLCNRHWNTNTSQSS